MIISTSPVRAARDRAVAHMVSHNPGSSPGDFIIHQKTLRLEQAITTRTEYQFDLYEVQGGQNDSEIKLNRNDAFFVYGLALNLALEDTTTPVPLSNTILATFPDPAVFAGVGEAVALEAFYNALLTFRTIPVERIQNFYTNELRFRPTDDVGGYGSSDAQRGYFQLSGEVVVDGSQNNSMVLSLNADADIAAAVVAGQTNWLVIKLLGHIVQNGARKVGQFM